ncbi:MAG: hypothetical protein ABEJ96_05005, partial [Thiohalorhabdaceae bacterium]
LAGGHIGSEAMPAIDGDVLEARILMPQGTPWRAPRRWPTAPRRPCAGPTSALPRSSPGRPPW